MSQPDKPIITHNYIKNNDFRTVYSSAIYGGLTLNGLININFCVDRGAIPTKTESQIVRNESGNEVFLETNKEVKEGFVREVQFGTIVDVPTAKMIVDWLSHRIKQIEDIHNSQKK